MDLKCSAIGLIIFASTIAAYEECHFPQFLYRPLVSGEERYWVSRTQFLYNTTQWDQQRILRVNTSTFEVWDRTREECGKDDCFVQVLRYRGQCVGMHGFDKYKVQITENGNYVRFKCYKFREINKNAALAWESGYSETNSPFMCSDGVVVPDEWVWVAPELQEWQPCPHPGGFDLIAFEHHTKEEVCPGVWLPSRLESECVFGEGIQFLFNNHNCNFFETPSSSTKQLYCWAHWEDGRYSFTLLAEANQLPHYVLREPRDLEPPFQAFLFFQPIVIQHETGVPHDAGVIRTLHLDITRSDPGLCYDGSPEHCPEFQREGKCINSALHQYANYCKKSCGLCELNHKRKTECLFSPDPDEERHMSGSWIYFTASTGRVERVTVETWKVVFSTLGEFLCKGIHHDRHNWFKVFSHYSNGCRPRYSCLDLSLNEEKLLIFRLSRSSLLDKSFDMCVFDSDLPPVLERVQHYTSAVLLPVSETRLDQCGIWGTIDVALLTKSSHHHHRQCSGTLSDWNQSQCRAENILKLELNGHCEGGSGHSAIYREFICIAYITVHDGVSILYTRERSGHNEYTCWAIHQTAEYRSRRPWIEAFQLTPANCDVTRIRAIGSIDTSLIAIETTNKGLLRNTCELDTKNTGSRDPFLDTPTHYPPRPPRENQIRFDSSHSGAKSILTCYNRYRLYYCVLYVVSFYMFTLY